MLKVTVHCYKQSRKTEKSHLKGSVTRKNLVGLHLFPSVLSLSDSNGLVCNECVVFVSFNLSVKHFNLYSEA
jgi:hypothetical protein